MIGRAIVDFALYKVLRSTIKMCFLGVHLHGGESCLCLSAEGKQN